MCTNTETQTGTNAVDVAEKLGYAYSQMAVEPDYIRWRVLLWYVQYVQQCSPLLLLC